MIIVYEEFLQKLKKKMFLILIPIQKKKNDTNLEIYICWQIDLKNKRKIEF